MKLCNGSNKIFAAPKMREELKKIGYENINIEGFYFVQAPLKPKYIIYY